MAKSKKSKKKSPSSSLKKQVKGEEPVERITLEEIDAMSSEDDDEQGIMVAAAAGSDEDEWDAEAMALRQAIADGAFDHLLKKNQDRDQADEEQDTEEVEESSDDDDEEEEEDSDSDEEEQSRKHQQADVGNGKALLAVTQELVKARKNVPWAETFDVIPKDHPLPFGAAGAPGNPLDVHDDLKRELAFYNIALAAANEGRTLCEQAKVPFSRPADFYAEMAKTDDHMAKIKDRLILETKKMDAVAQRKTNKEQKLRAKEAHANKIAEKSKRKKEHLAAVDEWAKSAAQNRGKFLNDNDDDDYFSNQKRQPSAKRQAANKKFGYGGKRGKFKQNDPKSMNDMSDFNPRGNFGGLGSKRKGGSGANRKGKRARDSSRSRAR